MTSLDSLETSIAQRAVGRELLCHCDEGVYAESFVRAIRENSTLSFEDVCDRLNVGKRCTACLLDAESVFTEVHGQLGEHPLPKARLGVPSLRIFRDNKHRSIKRFVIDTVDRMMPKLVTGRYEVSPIFARPGLKTLLGFSNLYPETIGPKSAPYRIRFRCVTANGTCFRMEDFMLPIGERREFDLCEGLPGPIGEEDFVCGSCWIEMDALNAGCNGSTRPHFVLKTTAASAPLHTQGVNAREANVFTARHNVHERQFISYVNLTGKPARGSCYIQTVGAEAASLHVECSVPPYGSQIIECPILEKMGGGPLLDHYLFKVLSDSPMRRHLMVAAENMTRISVDHI